LLIDELDKVDHAFEATLLEILSVWALSIPRLGVVSARSIPFTVITSNQERRLGDPLRRRSFYLRIEYPTAEREGEIVARRTPEAAESTHRLIAGFAKALRAYSLEKPPSVSEMIDIALALGHLGITEVTNDHRDVLLPLIAKTEKDRQRLLLRDGFSSIIHAAKHFAASMQAAEAEATLAEMAAA
jgi:MoxR-like ATPase